MFVDADRLAGWIGRVIPRAVIPPAGGPMGTMCVECTGEGIVLIEPKPEADPSVVSIVDAPPEPVISRTATPPPPPPAAPPAEAKPEETDPDAAIDSLDRLDEI